MKNLQLLTFLVIGLLIVMLVNIMPIAANGDNNSSLRETLEENRQLWRSQTIKNYQYIYQQQ